MKFKIIFSTLLFFTSCSHFSAKNRDPQQVVGNIGGNREFTEMVKSKKYKTLTCTMSFDIHVKNKDYKNVSCLNPLAEDGSFHCDSEKRVMSFPLVDHIVGQVCAFESSVNTVRSFPVNNAYKKYDGAVASLFVNGDPRSAKLVLMIGPVKSLPLGRGAQSTPVIGSNVVKELDLDLTESIRFSEPVSLEFHYGIGSFTNSNATLDRVHVDCSPGASDGDLTPLSFVPDIENEENFNIRKSIAIQSCNTSARNLAQARKQLELWKIQK